MEIRSLSDIEGMEDYYGYTVNELGQVFSTRSFGGVNRMLSPGYRSKQYPYQFVRLSGKNNNIKSFYVHRLVALAFLDNGANRSQVNHINRDKTDNRLCNLEWVTMEENMKHWKESESDDDILMKQYRRLVNKEGELVADLPKTYRDYYYSIYS
tara:strand:- start:49 stop:510 length:462 start_codon:yes stop_codon:yes gene_type:complete